MDKDLSKYLIIYYQMLKNLHSLVVSPSMFKNKLFMINILLKLVSKIQALEWIKTLRLDYKSFFHNHINESLILIMV